MYTLKSNFRCANQDFNQTISWKMLSDDQCEEIVMTGLELLERSGAAVQSQEARDIFAAAGCWVEGQQVYIPSAKAEWAIRTAPSRLTLCDRRGQRAILMETESTHCGPGFGAAQIFDRASGEPRPFQAQDIAELARVTESMDVMKFACAYGVPAEYRPETAPLYGLEQLLTYSSKPILQPVANVKQARYAAEMAAAAAGNMSKLQRHPSLVLDILCQEPRLHSKDAMETIAFAAAQGIPFIYRSKLVAGDTAPASTAGSLVVAVANFIVGLLLAQLVKEGAPVIAGGQFTVYDEANSCSPWGAPESALMGSGFANICRWLRLPNAVVGGIADSPISDAQYGMEMAMGLLTTSLAGANMAPGAGLLGSGKTASLVDLAMCEETAGVIYRILRSFEVSEDTKAVGVYDQVEPGGSYLGEAHTSLYFKAEQYWPRLMSRLRIQDWIEAGSKSLWVRANEYVEDILSGPLASPLGEEAAAAIKSLLQAAEAEL